MKKILHPRLGNKSSSNSLSLINQDVFRKGNFIVILVQLNLKTFIEHLIYSDTILDIGNSKIKRDNPFE